MKYLWLSLLITLLSSAQTNFVVLVTAYNNELWFEQNLNSIFSQHYNNYRVVYIDDCSTDDSSQKIVSYIRKHKLKQKVTFVQNKVRQYKMANLYYEIYKLNNRDVVVELDGDDFLAHPWVLSRLDEVYSRNDIWFTYGQFIELSRGSICSWNKDMPLDVVKKNAFRKYTHLPSHLRTFYAGLFKKININDLKMNGKFLRMTSDVAIALPMIEMAADHFKFIAEPLLIYNDLNGLNDHKVDAKMQWHINTAIRSRAPYHKLQKLN